DAKQINEKYDDVLVQPLHNLPTIPESVHIFQSQALEAYDVFLLMYGKIHDQDLESHLFVYNLKIRHIKFDCPSMDQHKGFPILHLVRYICSLVKLKELLSFCLSHLQQENLQRIVPILSL